MLEDDPSHTLKSLKTQLDTSDFYVSLPTISKYIKKLDYTRKRLSIVPAERNSLNTINQRQDFCRFVNNIVDDDLIFLDETGFNLHSKSNYGYSLKNVKCFVTKKANRGTNVSVMVAISKNGIIDFEINNGAFNGDKFINFIENKLRPHFKNHPRKVLVMDNCSFHHRSDVRQVLENHNISYKFLPPYSPQLNPIEEYFSHLKANYNAIRPAPISKLELFREIEGLISNDSINFDVWYVHMRRWVERGIARQEFI